MDVTPVMVDKASLYRQITATAREKLGKLGHMRINPARLIIPGNTRASRGGYASVVVATLLPSSENSQPACGPGSSYDKREFLYQQHVAVKKLSVRENTDLDGLLRAFVREIGIVASIHHPNVVRLIGFVEDIQNGIAWMIFPWEANDNIREFLSSRQLRAPERISLINDVVAGVEYLHSCEPPIWHGDLKSLNILVNNENHAVVTDFGSARVLRDGNVKQPDPGQISLFKPTPIPENDSNFTGPERSELVIVLQSLTGPAWSTRWASPERLNGQSPDLPSDIWALGWHASLRYDDYIMTGYLPFHGISNDANIILRVVTGKLPPISENEHMAQIRALCGLLLDCWNPDPDRRPTARDCLHVVTYMPTSIPPQPEDGDTNISSLALLMALGQMSLIQGDQNNALRIFQQAVDVARASGEDSSAAAALNGIGEIKILQNQPSQASAVYKEALDLSSQIGDDWDRANAVQGLGRAYVQQDRVEEAVSAYTEAKEIYVRLGNHLGEANALKHTGAAYVRQRRYAEATTAYEAAREIYISIGNEQGKGASAFGLGNVHYFRGNFEEAIQMYVEARDIFSRVGEERGAANATYYLGTVFSSQSRYPEAISEYERALNTFSGMQGGERGKLEALLGLGHIYDAQRQYPKAISTYKDIIDTCTLLEDEPRRAQAMVKLASLYLDQSRHSEAGPLFAEAGQIYESLQDRVGKAKAIRGIGLTLMSEQRYQEAMAPLNDALLIFQLYGHSKAAAECTAILQSLDSELASDRQE